MNSVEFREEMFFVGTCVNKKAGDILPLAGASKGLGRRCSYTWTLLSMTADTKRLVKLWLCLCTEWKQRAQRTKKQVKNLYIFHTHIFIDLCRWFNYLYSHVVLRWKPPLWWSLKASWGLQLPVTLQQEDMNRIVSDISDGTVRTAQYSVSKNYIAVTLTGIVTVVWLMMSRGHRFCISIWIFD